MSYYQDPTLAPNPAHVGDTVVLSDLGDGTYFGIEFDGGGVAAGYGVDSFVVPSVFTVDQNYFVYYRGYTDNGLGGLDQTSEGGAYLFVAGDIDPDGWYYNPDTDQYQFSPTDPGAPWIPQDPPALEITSVVINIGKGAGGESVTINGDGFAEGDTFSLNGVSVSSIVIVSPTQATGITGAAVLTEQYGTHNVLGFGPDGQSATLFSGWTYFRFDSVFLNQGPPAGGQNVVLNGIGFDNPDYPVTGVTFDGVPATGVSIFNDTVVECNTPAWVPGIGKSIPDDVDVEIEFGSGDNFALLVNGYQYQAFSWTLEHPDDPVESGDEITITSPEDGLDFLETEEPEITYLDEDDVLHHIPIISIREKTSRKFRFILPFLPPEAKVITIMVTGDGTQFSGSMSLGKLLTIFFTDATGIYKLVIGKRADTLYDNTDPGTTVDTKIPNPFIKTAFLP